MLVSTGGSFSERPYCKTFFGAEDFKKSGWGNFRTALQERVSVGRRKEEKPPERKQGKLNSQTKNYKACNEI